MPSEETKIFEISQNPKLDKAPFIIYACIIEKTDGCKLILKIHLHQT